MQGIFGHIYFAFSLYVLCSPGVWDIHVPNFFQTESASISGVHKLGAGGHPPLLAQLLKNAR